MAYLGRKGASAALTSADIPDGSISAVKVAADVATQAEIDLKANLASPTLTTPNLGTPSAVTLTNAVFPAGHVLQVVRKSVHSFPYKVEWLKEGRLTGHNNDFGHYSHGVVIGLEEVC